MPLITGQGYQLTPNISPIAEKIGQTLRLKEQQAQLGEEKAKKEQALVMKQAAQTAGAHALRIRGIKDPIAKRKEIAIMAQKVINEGGDSSVFADLLNIQDPDELNLALTRIAVDATDAGKYIDERLNQQAQQKIGTYNPRDYTVESFAEFRKTGDPASLVRHTEKTIDIGGVPHRLVPGTTNQYEPIKTAEEIGESRSIIKQREKFGEMTGASRAKAIDKGVERIQNIDKSIENFDKAIAAIDKGATTGALMRFAPTVRQSTAELEQIQNLLALDVLNSATFGALSEKELEVVKQTAMPEKLSPPELREWFELRKAGEQKLRAYFSEQIEHLDQGGTVASFLRKKERERGDQQPATPQDTTTPPSQVIRFDAQGNIIP